MAVGPACSTPRRQAPCSPPRPSILLRDHQAHDPPTGVLVLINNYQGDRMAWDMAIEMAAGRGHQGQAVHHQRRRRGEGQPLHDRPPRRGGQLLRHQGCGAAAEEGESLDELIAIATRSTTTSARWASR